MAQRKIESTGNEDHYRVLRKIDENFDDAFGQMVCLYSAYTLTSQTGVQALFNATTNGQIFLRVGTYEFEADYTLSSMSASSASFGFALGANNGLVIASQGWSSIAMKSTLATQASTVSTFNTAANTALTAAGTGTVGWAHIKGVFRVTTAGNLQPQVSLGSAAAAVVGANSWFRLFRLDDLATSAVYGQPQPNSNGMNWN